MKYRHCLTVSFSDPASLLQAHALLPQIGGRFIAAYGPVPLPVPGSGTCRSRLASVCLLAGLTGGTLKIWFQIWASAVSWPIDVGGRPWNSWPAFVPLTFEVFVLFAGCGLFLSFLLHHRLYPGQGVEGPTDLVAHEDFVMVVESVGPGGAVTRLAESLRRFGGRIQEGTGGGTST